MYHTIHRRTESQYQSYYSYVLCLFSVLDEHEANLGLRKNVNIVAPNEK